MSRTLNTSLIWRQQTVIRADQYFGIVESNNITMLPFFLLLLSAPDVLSTVK